MPPVVSGVVIEGQEGILLIDDLRDCLGPLRLELTGKLLDGSLGLLLVLGTGDLLDRRLRSTVDALWHRIEHVGGFVDPVAPSPGLWEYVPDGAPEPQCSVSYRKLGSTHPTLFEVSQKLRPALGRFPVAVCDSYQFLRALQTRSNHHRSEE